jgi:hypothetical protein
MVDAKPYTLEEFDRAAPDDHYAGDLSYARLRATVQALDAAQAQAAAATQALYGHASFVGPCAHGSDPWDRCDDCGNHSAINAAVTALNAERAKVAKLREALKEVMDLYPYLPCVCGRGSHRIPDAVFSRCRVVMKETL